MKSHNGRWSVTRRHRVPTCTHIVMDRAYDGNLTCFVCGRRPSLGFVYACRQDLVYNVLDFPGASQQVTDDKQQSGTSQLRRELFNIGLSESVIQMAEKGLYTTAQLEKLKSQKRDLKRAIEAAIEVARINALAAHFADVAVDDPLDVDGPAPTPHTPPVLPIVPPCNFQACHTCRPFFRDRLYASIPAVISGAHPEITPAEAAFLPTKDARILGHIGLRSNPEPYYSPPHTETANTTSTFETTHLNHQGDESRSSEDTLKTTQTDVSILRHLRHPRRRFYSLMNRSSNSITCTLNSQPQAAHPSLRASIKAIFGNNKPKNDIREPPAPTVESTVTLPYHRSGRARFVEADLSGETVAELDLGPLRRLRRHVERLAIRKAKAQGGFESGPRMPAALAFAGGYSAPYHLDEYDSTGYESASSLGTVYSSGSEIEVAGGVALLEESVELNTPDIQEAAATITTTDDGHVEVELDGDVVARFEGDSGIMTRV